MAEWRTFLHSYINQINSHYGLSITVEETCQIAKYNLSQMGLSQEIYEQISNILDNLISEFDCEEECERIPSLLDWLFEKSPKKKKNKKTDTPKILTPALSVNITEIPGVFPFVVGLLEGALGTVLLPIQPIAGGILIGDGLSRIVQGIQENAEGNLRPNPTKIEHN